MNSIPKVLILSRNFRAGDAITILNLFSRYPKNYLFCASINETEFTSNFNEYYVWGSDEIRFHFPFTKLAHVGKSHIATDARVESASDAQNNSLKRMVYERLLLPVLQRLDLYETRYSMSLSDGFANWIEKISPDIIYTSIGDIPMAYFVLDIHKRFPYIKIAVHGFDDWLSPTYKIFGEEKHRSRAEELFKKILDIASYHFTSSEKMALEYKKRYGHVFKCFPNPARLNAVQEVAQKSSVFNVVFVGKVGWHNNLAIKDMISCVNNLHREGVKIQFDIYTDATIEQQKYFLGSAADSTVFHKSVPNTQIPAILTAAHVLFLPISITDSVEKFTRYSMSTKMGEYLSSGVPMIYCGPSSIAMTEFLKSKDCAIVIDKSGEQYIREALLRVLKGDSELNEMCIEGVKLARSYFDSEIVSNNFAHELQGDGK